MNGARSTFTRKGYWLTALAAAVLAASPGTAYAQSVGFVGTSSTMMERRIPRSKDPCAHHDRHQRERSHRAFGRRGWRPEKLVLGPSRSSTTQTLCTLVKILRAMVTCGGFGWTVRAQPSMRPSSPVG